MPFPDHKFTIHGGCNCRAIRYIVEVPSFCDRTIHPTSNQDGVRYPFSAICHCNDCRRATGALINYAYCCALPTVSFSLNSKTSPSIQETWIPATSLFPPGTLDRSDTFLEIYASSEERSRSFCGRCGTTIAYSAYPLPTRFKGILDLWTGTVDREDLGTGWFRPEKHFHTDSEIDWVGKLAVEGTNGFGVAVKYGRGTG